MRWDSCVLWLEKALQGNEWTDLSQYKNNGVMTGAKWNENAILFDGIDDVVRCAPDITFDITDEITMEVLIKPYSYGEGDRGRIVSKYNTFYISIISDTHADIKIWREGFAYVTIYTNNGSVPLNKWSHVVATYNGAIQKGYVNGILQTDTESWSGVIRSNPTHPFRVGNNSSGSRTWDGKIALVRVYNKAATAQQVRELYEQSYRLI